MSETIQAREVEPRIITEEWRPVAGPYRCSCGHDHYARQQLHNGEATNLSPQYGFCEEPECSCMCLRRIYDPGPRTPDSEERGEIWDAGFTACAHEHMAQRKDPDRPITRTNPYQEGR